jgi:cyclopropane-fatty-acyl-phospholipid synthase
MSALSIEHSSAAYRLDYIVYGMAVFGLSTALVVGTPRELALPVVGMAAAGVVGWSAMEYGLHRFVLHGLQPFSRWHAEHHQRPRALIGTPTLVSAPLFALLVALPALWLWGVWLGMALTLGVLSGYLAYSVVHHGVHHWKSSSPWWKARTLSHARHHHLMQPACFGVTTGFWDGVMRTTAPSPGEGRR